MPEGPEVETIRRGLAESIVGERISGVEVLNSGSFITSGPDLIERFAVGSEITRLVRHGKVLVAELSSGYALMFHLKMTGQVVLTQMRGERLAGGHPNASMTASLPDRSTRVVFHFASGGTLYFNDQRKFGWIKLVPLAEVADDSLVKRLGPDPRSREFTREYLVTQLKRHAKAPVKPVILDQSVVAGIGNIYADESLHLSKIHPARLAGSLTSEEQTRLHAAIIEIMNLGIVHGGTSFSHYVNSLGGRGDYLDHARVFRRQGQPCPVCGTTILKTRVAGRGTHFCPVCQPVPKKVAK